MDVEPLDLGPDVKAVNLDLVEDDENREPVRGEDAAAIWTRVLPAIAGDEKWALDFYSHLDRVEAYCADHAIDFREANNRSLIIPALDAEDLEPLLNRFQGETFGMRAGGKIDGDAALENELAKRGADAYHKSYPNYFFCAICDFENGSLVVLSDKMVASEVVQRIRPVLQELEVEVRLPS